MSAILRPWPRGWDEIAGLHHSGSTWPLGDRARRKHRMCRVGNADGIRKAFLSSAWYILNLCPLNGPGGEVVMATDWQARQGNVSGVAD